MTRVGLIRACILLDVSDDYENLSHVQNSVVRMSRLTPACERAELIALLSELMEQGFVEAYFLDPREPVRPLGRVSDVEVIKRDSTYFYITAEGLRELTRMRSAADWPFDDFLEFLPKFKLDGGA